MDEVPIRVGSRSVYRDPEGLYCEVFLDRYQRVDGRVEERHRIAIGSGPPGVVILAQRDDALLVVRQWRPAIERWMWELPRGFGESTPEADAARELLEEGGLTALSTTVLGEFWVDSGMLSSQVAVVLCTVDDTVSEVERGGEISESAWWSLTEVDAAVARGALCDGISLAAWAMARPALTAG